MANEIQFGFQTGRVGYFTVRDRTGQIWNLSGPSFEAFNSGNWASYAISATEQGISAYYAGNFPTTIVPGVYHAVAKERLGAAPVQTDPTVAVGDYQWDGAATFRLSDLATSGQVGLIGPVRLARGVMVQNFHLYLRSSVDHVTAFTSGVVSGQIARDGGSFGALQSGAFTEIGQGFYRLQALTSGDTLANTFSLLFTAVGISGGSADPLPLAFITQRVSGQA